MTKAADDKGTIYQRLARVFGKVGSVEKNGENKFHGYNYAKEEDFIRHIRPLLAAEGLFILASVGEHEEIEAGHYLLSVNYTIYCETGESIGPLVGKGEGRDVSNKGGVGDKALYKALTGSFKYFLSKSFMVATGNDPEADEETDKAQAAPKQNRPQQTPPFNPQRQQPRQAQSESPVTEEESPRGGKGLSKEDAQTMHISISGRAKEAGVKLDDKAIASEALGRKVETFEGLTEQEVGKVWGAVNRALREAKAS